MPYRNRNGWWSAGWRGRRVYGYDHPWAAVYGAVRLSRHHRPERRVHVAYDDDHGGRRVLTWWPRANGRWGGLSLWWDRRPRAEWRRPRRAIPPITVKAADG